MGSNRCDVDVGNVIGSRLRSGAIQSNEFVEVNPRDTSLENISDESLVVEISNPATDSRGALNVSDEFFNDAINTWTYVDS